MVFWQYFIICHCTAVNIIMINMMDRALSNADHFAECLVRLPMFYELTNDEVDEIVRVVCG